MRGDRPTVSKFKIALAGILLVLVLVLVVQNQDTVTTEVLFWTFEAPQFALLALVFLGGIAVGYILGRSTRIEFGR